MSPLELVNIARLVKTRAFPKAGVVFFKAQLFNPGSSILKMERKVYLRRSLVEEGRRLELAEVAKALGAKWGEATAVSLAFYEKDNVELGDVVAVERAVVCHDEKDILLDDLLGLQVLDAKRQVVGVIEKIHHLGEQSNLEVAVGDGTAFELPLAWLDLQNWSRGQALLVPRVREFMDLDGDG